MEQIINQVFKLAIATYEAGQFDQSQHLFQKLSTLIPQDPNPYAYLGLIATKRKQYQVAANYFEKSIQLEPNNPLHHANYAGALIQLRYPKKALAAADKALALDAHYPAALLSSALALLFLTRNEESSQRFQHLFTQHPSAIEQYKMLIKSMLDTASYHDVEKMLRMALSLSPFNHYPKLEILIDLGDYLTFSQQIEEAYRVYQQILEINPRQIEAHYFLCLYTLKNIYKDETDLYEKRALYESRLIALREICLDSSDEELKKSADYCFDARTSFLLAYQGENDRHLQALYGDVMACLAKAYYPEWTKPLVLNKRAKDERIRVGLVSGYFNGHSNWKTHIDGLIEQLNHKDFIVYGYHTDNKFDIYTNKAFLSLERLTTEVLKVEELCEIIRKDDLDILFFPEIGMNPLTFRLACLRLAPIQCTSWGHPNTSGLHTMDNFLSSELMEPPDGDDYYTEKLVRLPNLSMYYNPLPATRLKSTRKDFGLREEAVLYWCCQAYLKYLPQDDDVFPQIALKVPNAQFVFIDYIPTWNAEIYERLEKAFAKVNLKASDYCVFLPLLPKNKFDDAIQLMDVFLDNMGWSGFNTTIESLNYNLPIVTFPGKTMRARHTAGILTMMGLNDCISTSKENFINRAIELGHSPEERAKMRLRIETQKNLVYRDNTFINALEQFLKSLVE